MAVMASPECTPWNVLTLPSPRASSIETRPAPSGVSPGQPWPWMVPPHTPSAASLGISGNGNSARSQ